MQVSTNSTISRDESNGKTRRVSAGNTTSVQSAGGEEVQKHFNQIAFEFLYSKDRWINHRGILHRGVGTHYEKVDDELEEGRIAEFCDAYQETVKIDGVKQRKHTKASKKNVLEVLNWAKSRLSVDPTLVDPPGLNCVNGVLNPIYNPDTKKFDRVFTAHSPDVYYTYVSECKYNPDADRTQALKMMECLDPEQGEILLRTLAASLDLETVRKLYGDRCVKALLAFGEGENGKDTIRVVMQKLLGHGVTGVAIAAFKTYDQGKKFPVSPLERSRLNWSSENSGNIVIDEVQSLKQAITGDTLGCERKNKDEYDFEPKSVFIFNVNKLPTIVGDLHAIRSRYGILSFNKRFTANPTKPNEIKADPRFKRDPEFIQNEVLPGFLLLLLDALDRLAAEGIDYSAIDETFDETRKQSTHLHAFCEDMGLVEDPAGEMTIKDLYRKYKDWMIDEGFATKLPSGDADYEVKFHKLEHWSDDAISCSGQLFKRLKTLFPGIERKRGNDARKIVGLTIVDKTIPPAPSHAWEAGMSVKRRLGNSEMVNGWKIKGVDTDEGLILVYHVKGEYKDAQIPWNSDEIEPCENSDLSADDHRKHSQANLIASSGGFKLNDKVVDKVSNHQGLIDEIDNGGQCLVIGALIHAWRSPNDLALVINEF